MNKEDKQWLIEVFPIYIGRTLRKETLDAYLRAEMLIDNTDTKRKITCNCQLRDVGRVINDKFGKWRKENT
tara:strand:- start:946 stop:1158 length:213 start_codon:yes stop_codon:yes gene_type:complete